MNGALEAPPYRKGLDFARQMDRRDTLAGFRNRFHIPKTADGDDEIYLCGNSLGLQPRSAADYVAAELDLIIDSIGVLVELRPNGPYVRFHRSTSGSP